MKIYNKLYFITPVNRIGKKYFFTSIYHTFNNNIIFIGIIKYYKILAFASGYILSKGIAPTRNFYDNVNKIGIYFLKKNLLNKIIK